MYYIQFFHSKSPCYFLGGLCLLQPLPFEILQVGNSFCVRVLCSFIVLCCRFVDYSFPYFFVFMSFSGPLLLFFYRLCPYQSFCCFHQEICCFRRCHFAGCLSKILLVWFCCRRFHCCSSLGYTWWNCYLCQSCTLLIYVLLVLVCCWLRRVKILSLLVIVISFVLFDYMWFSIFFSCLYWFLPRLVA